MLSSLARMVAKFWSNFSMWTKKCNLLLILLMLIINFVLWTWRRSCQWIILSYLWIHEGCRWCKNGDRGWNWSTGHYLCRRNGRYCQLGNWNAGWCAEESPPDRFVILDTFIGLVFSHYVSFSFYYFSWSCSTWGNIQEWHQGRVCWINEARRSPCSLQRCYTGNVACFSGKCSMFYRIWSFHEVPQFCGAQFIVCWELSEVILSWKIEKSSMSKKNYHNFFYKFFFLLLRLLL